MEIVFIKAPQTYLSDPDRNPPLGMMYIGAVAKKMGLSVQYIDFSRMSEGVNFLEIIPETEFYAFTVSIMDYYFCLKLAAQLKHRNKCVIIFGGMLPTTAPKLVKSDVVDSNVKGEGERAFHNLLTDFLQGKQLAEEYMSPVIKDLDSIEFPLRNGINFISNTLLEQNIPSTTIITSRGCPYNCAFCASKTIWGRKVRFRSAENVLREIDFLIENNEIQGLRFLDDTLTLREDRLIKICQGLRERNISWRCSTRSELITKELAGIMHDSGCKEVGLGVESADPQILEIINKGVKIEQNEKAIKTLKDVGIKVACFFMNGLPGEKENTPDLNIAFLKRTNPDRVFCATFMPYPGTAVWNNPDKYKIKILTRNLSKYNQVSGIGEDREFVAVPFGLTYEQLFRNRKRMIDFLAHGGKIRE